LAASGASFAQSSVTISGYIGAGYQSDKDAVKGFAMTDSRIQLSGTEDLGGGLKASFVQQFRVNGGPRGNAAAPDVRGEDSSLSLAGGFGTVAYAKTRGSTLLTNAMLSGASLANDVWAGPLTRTAIDLVSYTMPAFNGFTVGLSRAEAEASTDHNHSSGGEGAVQINTISAGYAAGPLAAGLAYKKYAGAATISKNEMFVSYDMGAAKLAAGYEKASSDTDAKTSLGVSVPMGALKAGVSYVSFGANTYTDVGVSYALSKRTAVEFATGDYTTWANRSTRVRVLHNF